MDPILPCHGGLPTGRFEENACHGVGEDWDEILSDGSLKEAEWRTYEEGSPVLSAEELEAFDAQMDEVESRDFSVWEFLRRCMMERMPRRCSSLDARM